MGGDPITFRRLRPEDAAIFARVAPGTFDHDVRADYATAFLASDLHEMVVALAGDLVVGMASGMVYFHPDKPAQFWINEVGTATGWQRRGIGLRMLEAMLEIASSRGCDSVWLATETENTPARAFYRRAGEREVPGLILYEWGEEEE